MTLIYGGIAPQMKGKLLNCLPGMRWDAEGEPSSTKTSKDRIHRSRFTLTRKSTKDALKEEGSSREDARFPTHRRKSTLSLTSIVDEELDARTNNQGQSSFFAKLPLEVRQMVYEYIMGEETVHLTLGARRKFGHFLCDNEALVEAEVGGGGRVECGCRVLVGGKESRRLDPSELGLLKVCRRIYSEVVPYLYTPHTFSLLHITHLLYLPSRLPASRLNNIRTLRLRWAIRALPYLRRPIDSKRYAYPEDTANWVRAWKTMADMKGLRDLSVTIVDPSPRGTWERGWLELEEKLLEAVKSVTQTRSFVMVLPYASCKTGWDMGDCRVVLRNPEGDVIEAEEDE